MAIQSGFFNSVNGDRRYDAKWFAQYFASFIGNGVFPNPSTGLKVVEGNNMTTIVKAGKGWINGYFIVNDSDYVLQHDIADGALKRIDRVVMRLNHLTRQIEILMKKGAFSSSPVAPSLQRDMEYHELVLADVLIGNGVTRIIQASITDQRFNSALCGIVKGVVDQIDTTDLFAQYDAEFDQWFESVKDYLNDTAVGSVANALEAHVNNADVHLTPEKVAKWDGKAPANIREDSTKPLRTEVVSSLPSSAQKGRIVFHDDPVYTPKFKGYDGGKWV